MAKSKVSIEKQKIRKAKATKAKANKSKLDKECYEKCVKEKGKFKCKPTKNTCRPQKQLPLVNRYNGQTPLISLPARQPTFTEPQKMLFDIKTNIADYSSAHFYINDIKYNSFSKDSDTQMERK